MNSRSFPYAQMITHQAQQRRAAIFALLHERPQLLQEQPDPHSPIVVATSALGSRLTELYRDPKQLLVIDRRGFEEVVAEILSGLGYSVELTARTRDGGRDIVAIGLKDQIHAKYLVECKRPDPGNPVGVGIVRQLFGVVEDESATKGILVATTYFSADALAFEERNRWRLELKDYDRVLDWIGEYLRLKDRIAQEAGSAFRL